MNCSHSKCNINVQVVGDMAQVMVSNKLSKEDVLRDADSLNLPTSVIQYLQVLTKYTSLLVISLIFTGVGRG